MVEADEVSFSSIRIRGRFIPPKKGWGTFKQSVFGINERDGAVYTKLVTDLFAKVLQATIRGKVQPESNVHSDCREGYDGLADGWVRQTTL